MDQKGNVPLQVGQTKEESDSIHVGRREYILDSFTEINKNISYNQYLFHGHPTGHFFNLDKIKLHYMIIQFGFGL